MWAHGPVQPCWVSPCLHHPQLHSYCFERGRPGSFVPPHMGLCTRAWGRTAQPR